MTMSQLPQTGELAATAMAGKASGDVLFRQLRHQTKNALQRILCLLAEAPELQAANGRQTLSKELQRRILLTADLSDALFGMTRHPGTLSQRLSSLCVGVVNLMGDPNAEIELRVIADAECPAHLEETVLRVTHELVGNAIKHGMHARLLGRIDVRLASTASQTVVKVSDNGWGCGATTIPGDGLSLAADLAADHNGTVRLERLDGWTVASLHLPHKAAAS